MHRHKHVAAGAAGAVPAVLCCAVASQIRHGPCLLQTAFTVARTMFETAGLPAHLADHVKAMDEVTCLNSNTLLQNMTADL